MQHSIALYLYIHVHKDVTQRGLNTHTKWKLFATQEEQSLLKIVFSISLFSKKMCP